MIIGALIPDRGDRPQLLELCKYMLSRQTRKPDFIQLVNYKPKGPEYDLTARVRLGVDILKRKGCSCIFIIENDDYYSPEYIDKMSAAWLSNGSPDLLGISSTYYYHIKRAEYTILRHSGRSSLFCTVISAKADIPYPTDNTIFLDLHLWAKMKGIAIDFKYPIAIGIKHGIGLTGGSGHNKMQYKFKDTSGDFLGAVVREERIISEYQAIAEAL